MNRRAAFLALLVIFFLPAHARADAPTADCLKQAAQIKPGMTRGKVFGLMTPDGGMAGIYKGERYYFPNLKYGEKPGNDYWRQKFCMLTIDFNPKGLPDDVYNDANRFASWLKGGFKYNDGDTVVRISPSVMDNYHSD
jgi:hypothetical protein